MPCFKNRFKGKRVVNFRDSHKTPSQNLIGDLRWVQITEGVKCWSKSSNDRDPKQNKMIILILIPCVWSMYNSLQMPLGNIILFYLDHILMNTFKPF